MEWKSLPRRARLCFVFIQFFSIFFAFPFHHLKFSSNIFCERHDRSIDPDGIFVERLLTSLCWFDWIEDRIDRSMRAMRWYHLFLWADEADDGRRLRLEMRDGTGTCIMSRRRIHRGWPPLHRWSLKLTLISSFRLNQLLYLFLSRLFSSELPPCIYFIVMLPTSFHFKFD